jgi:putative PIN family toxin of toxin-antitoxin system
VVVSGLLWGGPPARVLDATARGTFTGYVSEELLDELVGVLKRPKFAKRLRDKGFGVSTAVREYQKILTTVTPSKIKPPAKLRDPKDIPVLRASVAASAAAIISGDIHLLELETFHGIPIITPAMLLLASGL